MAAGIAAAGPTDEAVCDDYRRWLAAGKHAGMGYLEKYDELRRDVRGLLPGARSVVSAAFSYRRGAGMERHPLIADYALGEDYHTAVRRRLERVAAVISELFPGSESRICVDTAPVFERFWAERAGVGFTGRNRLLYVPGVGSKVFLGEILTTAALAADEPVVLEEHPCGSCHRCIDACPGGALDSAEAMDARKCLSYHTIENRDAELPEWVSLRGRRIYGCDICQDVCPLNAAPEAEGLVVIEELRPRAGLYGLRGTAQVRGMTHEEYVELFRGSAVRRAKLWMLQRNAEKA